MKRGSKPRGYLETVRSDQRKGRYISCRVSVLARLKDQQEGKSVEAEKKKAKSGKNPTQ